MEHTESELREIAKGRRLHKSTKGMLTGLAIVAAYNAMFRWDELLQWENSMQIVIFLAGAMFTYLYQRLKALSELLLEDSPSARTERNLR
jgi:hypothetical protein